VLGFEWDEDLDTGARPPGLMQLSATTIAVDQRLLDGDAGTNYAPGVAFHSLTLYRHASGGLVFGAGTTRWAWGLDDRHDSDPSVPDMRMRQATVNLLADMGVQPPTLQPGLVAAEASTDTTAPHSVIALPENGASIPQGHSVIVSGTAADAEGVVAAVEVSVDGGTTWHPATGDKNWTFSWRPQTNGAVTILSRAVDDSGNLETPGPGIGVTVVTPAFAGSIWDDATVPTVAAFNDPGAVELGLKFRSNAAGAITGIRFYKGAGNTGPHVGTLWTARGTLLASVSFTAETASGWQQANLPSPVAVTAGTMLVVSYHAPAGHYAADGGYFSTSGVASGPLHALGSSEAGGNGVFVYGSESAFPTNSFNATNYWVDVVFSPVTA
jgi:hypothetical protein